MEQAKVGTAVKKRTGTKQAVKKLKVTSHAFKSNTPIPQRYTCEGEDINPPLDIENLPKESKSLVLMVEDTDSPTGTWLHWLAFNVPVTEHVPENEMRGYQGVNDLGRKCYGGPCPPTETHHYFFKVYALDNMLNLGEGSALRQVEEAMKGHVIAYGELVGICERSPYH